jgi:mono/diheme cytochrome c family protein
MHRKAPGVLAVAGLVAHLTTPCVLEAQRPQQPRLILESIDGSDSFEFYCASCHGTAGKGDGPTAPALRTPPPDLTSLARRSGGAFPVGRVRAILTGTGDQATAHGSTEMPVWGPIFRGLDPSEPRARRRIENIVAHLESLQEPSAAMGDLGARLFMTHCATCHGRSARGDGPLAEQLRRTPPDLASYAGRNGGVFPSERLYRIIEGREVRSHGNREMPVWGDAFRRTPDGLTEEEAKARIAAIVKYLRAIQQRAG